MEAVLVLLLHVQRRGEVSVHSRSNDHAMELIEGHQGVLFNGRQPLRGDNAKEFLDQHADVRCDGVDPCDVDVGVEELNDAFANRIHAIRRQVLGRQLGNQAGGAVVDEVDAYALLLFAHRHTLVEGDMLDAIQHP